MDQSLRFAPAAFHFEPHPFRINQHGTGGKLRSNRIKSPWPRPGSYQLTKKLQALCAQGLKVALWVTRNEPWRVKASAAACLSFRGFNGKPSSSQGTLKLRPMCFRGNFVTSRTWPNQYKIRTSAAGRRQDPGKLGRKIRAPYERTLMKMVSKPRCEVAIPC